MKLGLSLGLALLATSNLCAVQQMVIVRHGESDHNAARIYNTNPKHPTYKVSHLTEKGVNDTNATAKKLLEKGINKENVVAIFVSPMPRTEETAKILADANVFNFDKVIFDDRLIEVDAGDLEGGPILEHWEDSMSEVYHCEPIEQINARVDSFFKEFKSKFSEGYVIVVTHGIITQKLKGYLCDSNEKIKPGHAEIYTVEN